MDYHRSFLHLTHEVAENLFHFDGKFLTSVGWLLGKPGQLTAEFNAGRRQSQVPPLRFYIFVTLLFFFGIHLLNHGQLLDVDWREKDRKASAFLKSEEAARAAATPEERDAQLTELAKKLVEANGQTKANQKQLEDFARQAAGRQPGPRDETKADLSSTVKSRLIAGDLTMVEIVATVEHQVPTLLFIGMPLFALWLKALYWRRHRYYIEHFIFSLHLHTWAFLVFMVASGYLKLAAFGPSWLRVALGWMLALWMLWYVVAAFRRVYAQGWGKTAFKVALLGAAYSYTLAALTYALVKLTLLWLVMA